MSDEKQHGGKASNHDCKNEQQSDSPTRTAQSSSTPRSLKPYIIILFVLLLLMVAYIVRYEPICIFTCAPLFSPKRHYPTKVEMARICGTPANINEPHCMTVPVVVPIIP
ncbi:hypothetical protein BU24DRAFT_423133 [Aaosphaeria arxii CBS 175.79]|uniref:Uncharacterized protein n=1 Tax=Aaosphaeria arxii CBS 175.79 TaxID=1450172 RepID=A0A6A5XUA5_9PLEO|nr:uncharacterized protein BU24DRAFT_423133 [Aaosphaeria arxii CBS 175.79]KAF2016782.1 hypothetical protein BU24DRAFT_423133 [Aaosphaeria arxii CBS 175.79]